MRVPGELGSALRWIAAELAAHDLWYGHGTDNARDEAVALIVGALGLPFEKIASWATRALSGEERARIDALVRRRIDERIPVPYLVNEAWFAGHRFFVDQTVLIPRSPIAELIEAHFAPWLHAEPRAVLDLCTGSGCIGIACALALPQARVTLTDVSDAALAVARRNIDLHRVADRVDVHSGDLFAPVRDRQFDLIVCNPPYVDAHDIARLPPEYRHEPRVALAAGSDGLDIVRRILDEARRHLTEQGVLIVEVGNSAPALLDAYPQLPFIWPDFERADGGVFVLDAEALR
jgi:ribosomal protein L3 glutamine methyltransferase